MLKNGYERNVRSRGISLSSAPFYASLAVILALGIFFGIFWAFNEYGAYQESISNIKENYKQRYESRVKEEVDNIIDFIEYKRSQADLLIENEIREKVQSAYSIASHIYSRHKDEMSVDQLRSMVAEVLRPIRWNNGKGYYFAGRINDGIIDLFADDPFFEGKTHLSFKATEGKNKITDIIDIVRDKGAGIYRYPGTKPDFEETQIPKISFVKFFKPFNWYIGAEIYLDDMERTIQEDVLSRIQNMHFGKDGEVLGFRFDGTIICHRDQRLIGRSIGDLVGHRESPYGNEMWREGLAENSDGYVSYSVSEGTKEKGLLKLSYVRAYEDWGWVLAATMYMDDMNAAIEYEKEIYLNINFKNITLFIILFVLAVSMMLLLAYYFSLKIKHGISLFTNFFRKAANEKIKIDQTQHAFSEFEDLANLANHMVDDRLQKEQLLRRDELRLDTLLQLGMMEKSSLQEKYNFILKRIVRITRSEGGYLALVNTTQSHLNLYSFFKVSQKDTSSDQTHYSLPHTIDNGGLPGEAVLQKRSIICNDYSPSKLSDIFPYRNDIRRHLDVPIFSAGKIVLVAGVYNNLDQYDNSDIRQMTMLLEGLWLHVLKICSEEEMTRLERQIIAVSEEERSTIGRDLHDDLGSHLSGVELLSKVLEKKLENENPDKAKELGSIRNLIREAIEKTRRFAQGLYPVHVVEHGLEAAIEEIKVEIENLFRVKCVLLFNTTVEKVENNVAIHMYYIIREAAFNAARHGKPDNIRITLIIDNHELEAIVEDDGSGFQKSSIQKGIGLHTMKYRAKAIGAILTIESEQGDGTIVKVSGEVQ